MKQAGITALPSASGQMAGARPSRSCKGQERGRSVKPGTREVDVLSPASLCWHRGAAGRVHISDANRFTSVNVTAWANRSKELWEIWIRCGQKGKEAPERSGAELSSSQG